MVNPEHADRSTDGRTLDDLDERLTAVERTLTDGDHDLAALIDAADDATALADLRDRVDDLEAQVSDLDAATQALRGYVGNVRSVNRDVERRADAALAKAEALEADHGTDAVAADPGNDWAEPDDEEWGDAPNRTNERENRGSGPARAADRCEHCGATHDAGASGGEHDRTRGVGRGDDPQRWRRPAADGGRDGWERTGAGEGTTSSSDDSTDEDGGLLSGLREAL